MPDATSPFAAWDNFYVIVGSSAGALTGLMFVVVTLGAEAHALGSEVSAFATPTVVHFATSLLISAIACTPWPALAYAGVAFASVGVAGVAYLTIVIKRARRATRYKPVPEDWFWYVVVPLAAYVILALAAARLPAAPRPASFAVAGSALLLLFAAMHNAWDAVTWLAVERVPQAKDEGRDRG